MEGLSPAIRFQRIIFGKEAEQLRALTMAPNLAAEKLARGRLAPMHDAAEARRLQPLVKLSNPADWDENWSLYWLPAHFRGKRKDPRVVDFLAGLSAAAESAGLTERYTFLENSCVHPHLVSKIISGGFSFLPLPIFGLSPRELTPSSPLKSKYSKVDPMALYKKLRSQKPLQPADIHGNAPAVVLWIQNSQDLARKELTGQGGWSCFYSTKGQDEFFQGVQSRFAEQLRASDLVEIPFIAPLFTSSSFTAASRQDLEGWFNLYSLCVTESLDDKGILISSNLPLDNILVNLVDKCRLNSYRN